MTGKREGTKLPKLGSKALRRAAAKKSPGTITIKGLIEEDQKLKAGCVLIMLDKNCPYPIKTIPGRSVPVKRGVAVNYDATKVDLLPPWWSVVSTKKSKATAGGES